MTKASKIFWIVVGVVAIMTVPVFIEQYYPKGKNSNVIVENIVNTNLVKYYDGNLKEYSFALQMGYAHPNLEIPGVNFQGSQKPFIGDLYLSLTEENITEFQSMIQKAQEWVETAKKEKVESLTKDLPLSSSRFADWGIDFFMVAVPYHCFPRVVFTKIKGKMWYFLNLKIFSTDALNWGSSGIPIADIYFDIEDNQSISNLLNYCTYENFQKIKAETEAKLELFK
jgi:uncharacterized membrane protein YuzA (DUF378 family)